MPVTRVKVEQNLFYNIGTYNGTSVGRMMQITGELSDVQIVSNTAIHNGTASHALLVEPESNTLTASRIVVNNNVWTHGEYGWFGTWIGTRALGWFAGTSFQATGNVLIGAGPYAQNYTNSTIAESISSIGFANPAGGDFSLSSSSPFRTAGAGGSTPGVDMSALFSSTAVARAMQ